MNAMNINKNCTTNYCNNKQREELVHRGWQALIGWLPAYRALQPERAHRLLLACSFLLGLDEDDLLNCNTSRYAFPALSHTHIARATANSCSASRQKPERRGVWGSGFVLSASDTPRQGHLWNDNDNNYNPGASSTRSHNHSSREQTITTRTDR